MSGEAWPVDLRGVTESVVTTLGPNDLYNVAALGIHAPGFGAYDCVTARTWGRTRTWRNFKERGSGHVQFVPDPVVFVDATLAVREETDPVLDSADAWARVSVDPLDSGTSGGTEWVDWQLAVEASEQVDRRAFTFNRGYAAVVEATVAASRLDVDSYDTETLRERLDYYEDVVQRCGGKQERAAFQRITSLVDW